MVKKRGGISMRHPSILDDDKPAPAEEREDQDEVENQEEMENQNEAEDAEASPDLGKTNSGKTEGATREPPALRPGGLFRATQFRLYNPYLKVYFDTQGQPTLLTSVDNWTQCQIDAGLIEKVKEG